MSKHYPFHDCNLYDDIPKGPITYYFAKEFLFFYTLSLSFSFLC